MAVSFERIHPALGIEVLGIDLRQPIDVQTSVKIRKAFDDNIVLVVRNQNLNEEQQLRAAEIFGKVGIRKRPVGTTDPGGEYDTPFMLVTNIVQDGKPLGSFGDGEMWFHHDTSYHAEPTRATLLYSIKLTSWGGQTCFSNMYLAYDMVPESLKKKLEGRRVLQMHDYKRRERLNLDTADLTKIRHHWQPIFVTHPISGKRALYVSRLMSSQIEGLDQSESESILEDLFNITEDTSIVYQHEWGIGDLVIWDNWCSIHARKDFPRDEERLMRRLTIQGQAMHF